MLDGTSSERVGQMHRPGDMLFHIRGTVSYQLAVLNLLRRAVYLHRGTPGTTAEVGAQVDEAHCQLFHTTARRAVGREVDMQHATPRQMQAMGELLLAQIEKHPNNNTDAVWFPDHWQEWAEFIKSGTRKKR